MNILVCVKQVLDDSADIGYDVSRQSITPENIEKVENAFDTYALEMATRLKEAEGGSITALSLGGMDAKNALKNCLAVGADEAVLLVKEDYQDYDTVSTAEALCQGIKRIEEDGGSRFDLIFCGKETTDFSSGQVGVMLAGKMGLPVVTDLVDIRREGDGIVAKHETEKGYELIEAPSPCVVTVSKPLYDPRYATVRNKMAARKKLIREISDIRMEKTGRTLISSYPRPRRKAGVKLSAASAGELMEQAMTYLKDAKVL